MAENRTATPPPNPPLRVPHLAVVLQENRQLRLSLVQLTDVLDGVGEGLRIL